ncbi:hypothetical protein [Blautia argi]|uniref:hypothetical protein n=1 Tax=Blautia argi TaxID=1912897 RepID=UPI001FA91426|nr:hypothetical protein [Blautia argi]
MTKKVRGDIIKQIICKKRQFWEDETWKSKREAVNWREKAVAAAVCCPCHIGSN